MAIKLKSTLSRRLIGREKTTEYGEKVKELKAIADELAPDGGLYIVLVDRSEVFLPSSKVIRDLMDLESLYNTRSLQANPKLAEEYGEIATHMKAIEKIISKRRKEIFKRRKAEKTEDKEQKTEEKEVTND